MPRRRVLTDAQLEALLALPTADPLLRPVLHLEPGRSRAHRATAIRPQPAGLCAAALHVALPGTAAPCGRDGSTGDPSVRWRAARPRAHGFHRLLGTLSDPLRAFLGFAGEVRLSALRGLGRREIQEWLLPVALATTSGANIAAALLEELRRRRVIVPGPTVIERLVAVALLNAERHVACELTRGLAPAQIAQLERLLERRSIRT